VNLRKDHCRNLQEQTTSEHVLISVGGGLRVLPAPVAPPRRPGALGRPAAQNNKPRRGKRQGLLKKWTAFPRLRPFAARNGGPKAPVESNTTLGNGYLGSRIDEERSKLRYLV
jgi:hypothetical protein